MAKLALLSCLIVIFQVTILLARDNGLARTPPMAWLTWERFRCTTDCVKSPNTCISEQLIKRQADRMVADGYKAAGYEYIIIDDCWLDSNRDKDGKLQPDPKRFPNGMKALADYVHQNGLKFGIYEDFGTKTCAGYPGSEFYMESDANTFASWGVDYVKFDGCNSDPHQSKEGYGTFGFYLNKTGRPMVYSCEWPLYTMSQGIAIDSEALIETCNLFRVFDDIDDSWQSLLSIINFYGQNKNNFTSWGGIGHWNDPDMLIIGDFFLTQDQQRVQMAMWAIFAAPLIMSNDLTNISAFSKDLLLNQNLIRINQDPLGIQGVKITEQASIQLWKRQLVNGITAFAVLNTHPVSSYNVSFLVSSILPSTSQNYTFFEGFTNTKIGVFGLADNFTCTVNSTGVYLVLTQGLSEF